MAVDDSPDGGSGDSPGPVEQWFDEIGVTERDLELASTIVTTALTIVLLYEKFKD